MQRKVQRKLIDEWVRKHGPNGVIKLAEKSGVSRSLVDKIRTGRVPVRALFRKALAKAIGASEDDLFPLLEQGTETEAS